MAPHGDLPRLRRRLLGGHRVRDDEDWQRLSRVIDEAWASHPELKDLAGRVARRDHLETRLGAWTAQRSRLATQEVLRARGVPAAQVATPEDRIEHDPDTAAWGLWPWARHREMGDVRVDAFPSTSRRPIGSWPGERRASANTTTWSTASCSVCRWKKSLTFGAMVSSEEHKHSYRRNESRRGPKCWMV